MNNLSLLSSSIYTRRQEQCFEIKAPGGEFVYQLAGIGDGPCTQMSIARVNILKGGHCTSHRHTKREECYAILEGQGLLSINGTEKIVSAGDVCRIPINHVHQISNIGNQTLKFYCLCGDAWVQEDYFPDSNNEGVEEVYSCNKQNVIKKTNGDGVSVYVLLSSEQGKAEKLSISLVKVKQGASSISRCHDKVDQGYLILEGRGKLKVGDQEREVTSGDVALIPAGQLHSISNLGENALKFYLVAADPSAMKKYLCQ